MTRPSRQLSRWLVVAAVATSACAFPSASRVQQLRSPVHASLSAELHSARITSDTGVPGLAFSEGNASQVAVDFTVQPRERSGLGLSGRAIVGSGRAPTLFEAGLLLGSRSFAVEVGGGTRTFYDPDKSDEAALLYPLARIGIRSRANLGSSPFSMQLRVTRSFGVLLESDNNIGSPNAGGWTGETGLSWTQPSLPFTASVGYRIERFSGYSYRQEVSALTLGGGFLFGRR